MRRKGNPIAAAECESKDLIRFSVDVDIIAATADGDKKGPPRFSVRAYNGGELLLNGWDLPVVIDLAGLQFAKSITANLHHDQKQIVGHVDKRSTEGNRLTLEGVVSGTGAAALEFTANAANGYPWQASVEARPTKEPVLVDAGKKVTVNGQEFVGPLYVSKKTKLYGVGFLPRGADENTSVKIAAGAADTKEDAMTFQQWIEAMGLALSDLTDKQKSLLQKKYDAEIKAAEKTGEKNGEGKLIVAAPAFDVDDIKAAANEYATTLEAKLAEHEDEIRDKKKLAEIKAEAFKASRELKKKAISEKWAVERFEVEAIKAASKFELELVKAQAPIGPAIHSPTRDASPQVIEAAICLARKLPHVEKQFKPEVLEAAEKHFRNISLQQVLIMAAAANGYQCRPGERIHAGNLRQVLKFAFIEAAGESTLSLPGILNNVANKDLLAGYMEDDQTWRKIAQVKSVNDFKENTSYRLLDNMEYEELPPAGHIKQGSVSEESYTRRAKTYAKMFLLDRRDIINDSLQAFDDLRTRIGRGASKKFNNVFWTRFLDNGSFFTTSRVNYITGATTNLGVNGVGLELGVTAFRKLRSPAADGSKRVGNLVGGRPKILLVPPELEFIADRLWASANVNTGGAATAESVPDANIHAGKYEPVVSDWLSDSAFTGYSATAWYLFRDPAEGAPMVVSFLNGVEVPTVESADADFDQLGIQFRGYHDFGCDQAEYLAGIKSKGAA